MSEPDCRGPLDWPSADGDPESGDPETRVVLDEEDCLVTIRLEFDDDRVVERDWEISASSLNLPDDRTPAQRALDDE